MQNVQEYTNAELADLLPWPSADANKYTRGMLTAVVGSERYPGAACLAAWASQCMGAGYTQVFTHPTAVSLVQSFRPSLVARPHTTLPQKLSPSLPNKPCAYLVGCGFDAEEVASEKLVHFVLEHAEAPVLVDGSGLAAITSEKGHHLLQQRFLNGHATVIAPHTGEASQLARVFNLPTSDPCELARLLALTYGVVAAVKGPTTFISDGEETLRMSNGTPALAKAGTGDVLAGMIGALLAQGMEALAASALGTELHARAGLAAAQHLTNISVCAEDVIEYLPVAIAELMSATGEYTAIR